MTNLPQRVVAHTIPVTPHRRPFAGDDLRRTIATLAAVARLADDIDAALDRLAAELHKLRPDPIPCPVKACQADLGGMTASEQRAHRHSHSPLDQWRTRKAWR